MPQGFIDSYANAFLDYTFGAEGTSPAQGAILSPTSFYIALFTVAPASDASGLTEVSAPEYARQAAAAADFAAAATRSITNTARFTFPEVTQTGGWGTVVGWGLYDAVTAGNLRMVGVFSGGSIAFLEGSIREFQAGDLTFTLPWTA